MELQVTEEAVEGATVLALSGELDLSTLPQLRGRLVRAVTQRPGDLVVVDLDGVLALDDTGLGAIVGAAGRLRAGGGDLIVICSGGRVLDLLRLTRLDRALDVYQTRAAALAAAARRPPA